VTINEVFESIESLTEQQCSGVISQPEAMERMGEILANAGASMTDEELYEIQRRALITHHELARYLSDHSGEHNYKTPGNDPRKAN
jgi:hypothetical protein